MSRAPGDFPAADALPETDSRPDTPDGSSHLRGRLERLPPGHPSSPYEADGSRRESAPCLRDLDTGTDDDAFAADDSSDRQADGDFRFTDSAWADHKEEVSVRRAAADAAGMSSQDRHTVDSDHEIWSAERQVAHGVIIDRIYAQAQGVPNDHKAIIAGGLCGAGKTTVLFGYAGLDRSQYLTVSPDNIKEQLARDGLTPEVEGLSPMEASDLVHRESSYIARQIASRAMTDGKNLIWDIQMSSRESVKDRIDNLQSSGYDRIDAIFVDIPVELSLERADARHREGEDRSGIGELLRRVLARLSGCVEARQFRWASTGVIMIAQDNVRICPVLAVTRRPPTRGRNPTRSQTRQMHPAICVTA
jgi:predicted kinase